MLEKFNSAWHVIAGIMSTFFVGSSFLILEKLQLKMETGLVISWTIATFTFLGIVALLIYGLVILRINKITVLAEKTAQANDLNIIADQLKATTTEMHETYELATKDILREANKIGLEMVYENRGVFTAELKELLKSAKTEVSFLGISIGMVSQFANFEEIIKNRTKEKVKFRFAFLERESSSSKTHNFYKQRALDEHYPDKHIGDLRAQTNKHIGILLAIRGRLDEAPLLEIAERPSASFMHGISD